MCRRCIVLRWWCRVGIGIAVLVLRLVLKLGCRLGRFILYWCVFLAWFWIDPARINKLFRIAQTHSSSTSITREASSMSVMLRTFNLRISSSHSKKPRTGCTPKKAKKPPNPPTSPGWTHSKSSATPSPSATRNPTTA